MTADDLTDSARTASGRTVAVVLNWRRKELTVECVEALSACLPERDIVIVDNGSGDGSAEYLGGRFPEARLVELPCNTGYAGGNNAGIRAALSMGAGHVFVLNNDVFVERECLRELTRAAGVHPHAGFVCPALVEDDDAAPTPPGRLDLRRYFTVKMKRAPEAITELDYAPGAAMLVRAEVFERVGFFDEELYLYCEDLDLSLRARAAGYGVIYVPEARARHVGQATSGTKSPVHLYHGFRNTLVVIGRYADRRSRLRLFVYKCLEAFQAMRHSLAGPPPRSTQGHPATRGAGRCRRAAAIVCAFVDFLLGHMSQAPERITKALPH